MLQRSPEAHLFVWSINGRCIRCQRTAMEHVMHLPNRPPADTSGCLIDHRSVPESMTVTDGGLQRSRCPECDVMVEPRAITGNGPQGKLLERGRGDLTDRHKRQLTGWFGWWVYNGGDATLDT